MGVLIRSNVRDAPSQARTAAGGHGQTNELPSTHLNSLLALGGASCSHRDQHHTHQALSDGHSAEGNERETSSELLFCRGEADEVFVADGGHPQGWQG